MCSTVTCHWSTRLIPFRIASSLARFIWRVSFSGRSQQASSMMDPLSSRVTPMASELASTQTVSSFMLTHQSPCPRSSCITLSIVSVITHLRVMSCTSSSHPDITEVTRHFMASATTLNQLHTGKWPTSFLHMEKVIRQVCLCPRRWWHCRMASPHCQENSCEITLFDSRSCVLV